MRTESKRIATIIFTLFILVISVFLPAFSEGQVQPPDRISPFVSHRFVQNSQNIPENDLLSLRDIFYYVSILNLTGEPIQEPERSELVQLVRSYQNADGGFGDWYNDRSKAGSTLTAIRTLKELDSFPLNASGVTSFVNRLQVSGLLWGNYGFRSSLKERDADISSTHDSLESLRLIDENVPNRPEVIFYLKDHQNIDGGFGYQTNRESDIIWDSTILHSQRGLSSLSNLGETPSFHNEAVSYILGNQETSGGFSNEEGDEARVSYTYNAIKALVSMEKEIPRKQEVVNFISSNQMISGGFIEYSLDTKEGLHTTYFAAIAMKILDGAYNKDAAAGFTRSFIADRMDGGFGDYPGLGSNSRITFDAVSVLNRIGKGPLDRNAAVDYVQGIRNTDGGYGDKGRSNVETTYRSVVTLLLLEEQLVDPFETVNYIRGLQNNDGGFGFSSGYVSRGSYTYRAIRTLDILGREPLDKDGVVNYLRSLQNPDGGFGNYYGEDDSDLTSTYRAVRGLSNLGNAPSDNEQVLNFIKGSQNPDGGFRRSPTDLTAPNNFSTSLFTYDAILALHFLGTEVEDIDGAYEFIESLRNPDLGFGEKEFFTSKVSDTFTSIWSYMVLFKEVLDLPPTIENITITPDEPTTTDIVKMRVRVVDPEDQSPEYVHAAIDGVKYLLQPEGNGYFSLDITLPTGSHEVQLHTTDGINHVTSSQHSVTVAGSDNSPSVIIEVIPEEGTEEALFDYILTYSHPDGKAPDSVEIQIDDGNWESMTGSGEGRFTYQTELDPGIHVFRGRAFDGSNYGYSDRISGPFVHSLNSTRPEWDLFTKIRDLIQDEYGTEINYTGVQRGTYNGKLAWEVDVNDEKVHVSYDGENVLNGEDEGNDLWRWFLNISIIFILLVVIGIVGFVLWTKYKNTDEGVDG